MNQENIGKYIAQLRKEKGLTQRELADKLDVTDRAVSNWENGRRLPDYTILPLLADTLGTSIQELLNGRKMTKEEMLELKDTLEKLIEYESDNQIKNNKKTNKYIVIGNILIALGLLQNHFGFLNYIFTENFSNFFQGAFLGIGMAFDLIGIYNNSHNISLCEKKKEILNKLRSK